MASIPFLEPPVLVWSIGVGLHVPGYVRGMPSTTGTRLYSAAQIIVVKSTCQVTFMTYLAYQLSEIWDD